MADETQKTVTVKARQVHTAFGKSYKVGDTYEIDERFVETVVQQGKAVRVDRPVLAPAKPSHPVTPLSVDEFHPKSKR